jgi:hypothetical protein
LTHEELTYYLLTDGDLYVSSDKTYLLMHDVVHIELVSDFFLHTILIAIQKNGDEFTISEGEYYQTGQKINLIDGQPERDEDGKIVRCTDYNPFSESLPPFCVIL